MKAILGVGGVAIGRWLYFRFYFAMPLLKDDEARQIEDGARSTRDPDVLSRWIRALLADRKARTALLQSVSRQLHHLRRRMTQATAYLQGLVAGAVRVTAEPWQGQVPCPHCGAPASRVHTRAGGGPGGHALSYSHPDGRTCTQEDSEAARGRPATRRDPSQQPRG